MMRSLYSGVAGLKTHQTKMDVIGNNISNVNTVGFKSSSVLFKDVLYQTTQSATGATQTSGGTNAKQIGLGTTVATVSASQTSGSAQSTNNPYDLMINGSSFFVVQRGGVNYFTKVGAFKVDDAGNLVTGDGDFVMGWQVDPENPNEVKRDVVSALRPEAEEFQTAEPEMTTKTYMSGIVAKTDPNLTTQDGVATTVSIYDNLGYSYTVKFKFTQNTDANGNVVNDNIYNVQVASIVDANNNDISGDYNIDLAYTNANGDRFSNLVFNSSDGSFAGVGGNVVAGTQDFVGSMMLTITPRANSNAGNVFQTRDEMGNLIPGIDVDFSHLNMYSRNGNECDIETHRGGADSTGAGRKVGTLTDVKIDTQGKLYGTYDNGVNKLLGQIAVANFVNPAGLEAIGGSLYQATKASGDFDGIGTDIASAGEKIQQGVLEMSNVDLSAEFTDMIVTQRGFQANSRIITVSDTLLEELINLKR